MDTEDNWEARTDHEKRTRYAPALAFFDQLPNQERWSMQQNDFTVGVWGSPSTHTEPLEVSGFPKLSSFAQELAELGISQIAPKITGGSANLLQKYFVAQPDPRLAARVFSGLQI